MKLKGSAAMACFVILSTAWFSFVAIAARSAHSKSVSLDSKKDTTAIKAVGADVGAPLESRREAVIKLVVSVKRADYEGDRPALKRLYEELTPFAGDDELGTQVRYWRGFALWRRAINGFNESVAPIELQQDLEQAVREFESAIAKDTAFIDAKVAAGSSRGYLLYAYSIDPAHAQEFKDPTRRREIYDKGMSELKEAQAAEPDNPRLAWVLGPNLWRTPPERGGGQDKTIESYRKALKTAHEQWVKGTDPLVPSWGEPELLMSLAWSNLNRNTPDLAAAEQYARSALTIVPDWHYVRDILLPQIMTAKAKH